MNTIEWKLSIPSVLDELMRDYVEGDYEQNLPDQVKIAVQQFIDACEYEEFLGTKSDNEDQNTFVEWNILVDLSMDRIVNSIIATEHTDFQYDLSGFVSQAVNIYIFKTAVKNLSRRFLSISAAEQANQFSFLAPELKAFPKWFSKLSEEEKEDLPLNKISECVDVIRRSAKPDEPDEFDKTDKIGYH
jgi:acyl carrier protein phosphodiesterase